MQREQLEIIPAPLGDVPGIALAGRDRHRRRPSRCRSRSTTGSARAPARSSWTSASVEFLDSSGVSLLVRARALLGREERELVVDLPARPGPPHLRGRRASSTCSPCSRAASRRPPRSSPPIEPSTLRTSAPDRGMSAREPVVRARGDLRRGHAIDTDRLGGDRALTGVPGARRPPAALRRAVHDLLPRLVPRLHPALRVRARLHGRVGLRGPHGRLLPRADAVRHGLRARASGTCARPTRSSTRSPSARSPPTPTTSTHPGATGRFARDRGAVRERDDGGVAMTVLAAVNVEAVVIFAIVLSITLGITYWASQRMTGATTFYAAGRQITGVPERPRDLRRLPLRGLVPRHRRPDLPLRLRRVPVLDRVPRRLPHRDVPAGRAHAQLRQVHDRRRAGVPPEPEAGALRGGARHALRRRLLPDRADGRRGRAHPGARRHRLHARRDPHRRLHALLRDLRRHARHHVGADHQGRAADGGHHRDVAVRARAGRLQPDPALQRRRRQQDGGVDVLARPGHVPRLADRHRLARPRARARHRRACRTS